jgi:magnesium transporter
MIRLLHRDRDGRVRKDVPLAELPRRLRQAGGLTWLDLVGEPPEVCEPILREIFGFHPLAIDDALTETHVPKLDDWGDYLYLATHAIHYDSASDPSLTTQEFDAFLGPNYLVTHHDDVLPDVDPGLKRRQGRALPRRRTGPPVLRPGRRDHLQLSAQHRSHR